MVKIEEKLEKERPVTLEMVELEEEIRKEGLAFGCYAEMG